MSDIEERLNRIENVLLWLQTRDAQLNLVQDRCAKVAKYLEIEEDDLFERLKPILGMKSNV